MDDMNPGNLRHRVTLQSLATVTDAGGGKTSTWSDTATVWAEVVPLSGFERIQAMQVSADLSHRVRIRYRPGVTSKMRIVFGARTFDVTAVIDTEERHIELILLCGENT